MATKAEGVRGLRYLSKLESERNNNILLPCHVLTLSPYVVPSQSETAQSKGLSMHMQDS